MLDSYYCGEYCFVNAEENPLSLEVDKSAIVRSGLALAKPELQEGNCRVAVGKTMLVNFALSCDMAE